ncbi:MAG: hypothetical protein AB7N76_09130 [Planctomycetota bacterium]
MPWDRYEGKPFLKLLESYVLRAIGELPDEQERALRAMEPKLQQVYGARGAWHELVASQMGFPDDLPATIRSIWDQGNARAAELGIPVDAVGFTRHFVDTNFVD